jgi:fluoride exporter
VGAVNGLMLTCGVGLMGALGAAARYLVVEWVARWWTHRIPLATLIINLSGAFALGLATAALATSGALTARLLIGAGFIGGYTTFSTLSFATLALHRRGVTSYAWFDAGASLMGGLVMAGLGMALGVAL